MISELRTCDGELPTCMTCATRLNLTLGFGRSDGSLSL